MKTHIPSVKSIALVEYNQKLWLDIFHRVLITRENDEPDTDLNAIFAKVDHKIFGKLDQVARENDGVIDGFFRA